MIKISQTENPEGTVELTRVHEKGKDRRYCKTCGYDHGLFYVCPSYPKSLKDNIKRQSNRWRKQLSDPNWCKKQVKNGIDPLAIVINRIFAGF